MGKHTNFNDKFRENQRKQSISKRDKRQDLLDTWRLQQRNKELFSDKKINLKPRKNKESVFDSVKNLGEKLIENLPLNKRKLEKQKRIFNKRAELTRLFPHIDNRIHSDTKIDSITWKQINKGFTVDEITWFFPFDFNKIYKSDKYFLIAYNDFMLERDFGELIKSQAKKKDKQLLKELNHIVNMTHVGIPTVKGSSSGQAGGAFIEYASMNECKKFINKLDSESNKQREHVSKFDNIQPHTFRYHTKGNVGWQYLSSGGSVAINEVTPHNLLAVCNAVLYHVTEEERWDFYKTFYDSVIELIPEMKYYLPKMYIM